MEKPTDSFKTRSEVPEKYRWNLELIYSDAQAWEKDFSKIDSVAQKMEQYKGKLSASAETLKQAYDAQTELDLIIERLYSFAHHRSDEDTRDAKNLGQVDRIRSKATEVMAKLSWMDPELLEAPIETLKKLQTDATLKDYSRKIEYLIRSKAHQRSAEVEEILSLVSEPLSTSYKAFSLLENADMKSVEVKNGKGEAVEVNHGNYGTIMEGDDRTLRENAFIGYLNNFGQYKNTFAATLDGHVRKQIFYSGVRKFDSAIEASLFSDTIPLSVYNGLINSVHQHLPLLHRLFKLRKKMLKLDDYSLWDNIVPMVKPAKTEVPYETGRKWVIDSAKPLGPEYGKILESAFDDRWLDVYYTPGKRSGAYSGGMYQSKPYILLNHKDNLGSTFTLAHELGHSMHSYLSNTNQPYAKAGYPIFLAEVASTTNEMLLHFYLTDLAEKQNSKEMKLYLLDHLFTQFRATLFRQVQFAEYERDIHAMVEKGIPLTSDSLSEHYAELNKKYFGPDVTHNEAIKYEWSRIPHFYYNFYVYKYATSFAAAQFFARKIYDGDTKIRDSYLEFLKSGNSADPLDTLLKAGMDLRDTKPIESAFKVFADSLDEFEKLI